MAIRSYKPTSPGRRFVTGLDFEELTTKKPHKKLTEGKKRSSGRNSEGHITSRHRGRGHKQRYRIIDFRRDKFDVPARVATIEYDPNRSANISLLNYADGDKRYILAPVGLKVGDTVIAGKKVDVRPANAMPIGNIPLGAIGIYSYADKLKVGLQQLMAGARCFNLDAISEQACSVVGRQAGRVRVDLLSVDFEIANADIIRDNTLQADIFDIVAKTFLFFNFFGIYEYGRIIEINTFDLDKKIISKIAAL